MNFKIKFLLKSIIINTLYKQTYMEKEQKPIIQKM